jgi:hypothetical protein
MKRWATLSSALLLCGLAFMPFADTASGQAGGGWTALFDGKNLDHWVNDGTADFVIEDGAVTAKNKKDPKAVAAYLISRESYKDFQVRAEFWVSDDANSGVFIRCGDPKKIGAKECYECNIFDKRPDPTYGTGSIVYVAEVDPMPKAGGKWSTMEITAKGRDLSITFDGKPTAKARVGLHDKGHIALQFGVGTVKFRKVEIKPL